MSASNPIQQLAQELESLGVEEAEQVIIAEPQEFPAISEEAKQIAAYQLWEEAGSVQDSPYTLNFWLEAETALVTQSPMAPKE